MGVLDASWETIAPPPPQRTIDWALEYAFNEFGKPYDDYAYPQLAAPGGPFDAADSGIYFDIWLQWGSRLGKTYGGQVVMLCRADRTPCPMMLVGPDEKLSVEVAERTKKMAAYSQRKNLRLVGDRQDRISFPFCRANLGWARSVSTLADKSVQYGQGVEIDKWEHEGAASNKAKEADPLKLWDDRFKDFITFLRWKDSTPSIKGGSRIERGRLGSCNAALYVPCPKCSRYQILSMGDGKSDRGCLTWQKNEAGKSDKDIARATATYICLHCGEELRDEHRGAMMRGGVWVPEGCGVDDDKAREAAVVWREPGRPLWSGWKESSWITGEPLRDGRDWGSQLSSLYALSRTWGDIAAEFIDSKQQPQNLRNFKNQWLAETWENIRRETSWEQFGVRVINNDLRRDIVPNWASLLSIGIDRQQDDGDARLPWVIDAWGPGYRVATIAYGQAGSFDELGQVFINRSWQHQDGGGKLTIKVGLFDSGYLPKGVDEFCHHCRRSGVSIFPCKGSNTAMQSTWSENVLGPRTSRPGEIHYMVDTSRTQLWIDNQVRSATKDDEAGYTLHGGTLVDHQDFLEQLLNDGLDQQPDKSGNIRESWKKIRESVPNDYRACRRYGYAAMLIATRGAPIRQRGFVAPVLPPEPESRFKIREHRIRR